MTRAKERRAAATPLLPVWRKERAVKGPCHCCHLEHGGRYRQGNVPLRPTWSMKDSRFMHRGRGGQLVPQERWASVTAVTALLSVWRKERATWRTVTAEHQLEASSTNLVAVSICNEGPSQMVCFRKGSDCTRNRVVEGSLILVRHSRWPAVGSAITLHHGDVDAAT